MGDEGLARRRRGCGRGRVPPAWPWPRVPRAHATAARARMARREGRLRAQRRWRLRAQCQRRCDGGEEVGGGDWRSDERASELQRAALALG